jgi:5-methylcytosine-specific restriction endonuclease McrA
MLKRRTYLCRCGCGQPALSLYIHGHNARTGIKSVDSGHKGRVSRTAFFEHNEAPFVCTFCGRFVPRRLVVVHHLDEDKMNDDPKNLRSAHRGCHASHHMKIRMQELYRREPSV